MSEYRLVVGLGNPGKKYERTRHNLGFLIVARIAKRNKLKFSRSLTLNAYVARGVVRGKNFYLLLPVTYMNHSGSAVKRIVRKKKIALENILIVNDDLNLPFGQLRLRSKGSDGGHNGLASVIQELATQDFSRLRVGIGAPARGEDPAEFVLSEFDAGEKKQLDRIVEEASQGCEIWLQEGTMKTMNQFNRRKDDE